jgi:peptide chain release factor 2
MRDPCIHTVMRFGVFANFAVTEQVAEEALNELGILEQNLRSFEIERLLSKKYDQCSCGMTIQSGAGGTEAQDWAGMLLRMYKRYAERKGFKVTVVDEASADFGIKSTEVRIEGEFAYGLLSGEKGTHRLVRMSPFNAQGKRQTSFAAVEAWPILPEEAVKDVVLLDKVMCFCSVFSSGLYVLILSSLPHVTSTAFHLLNVWSAQIVTVVLHRKRH